MASQDETEGCGKGQTDWVDVVLTGKPADRYVSDSSMCFANVSLGGRTSQSTYDSKTTSRFMVDKIGDLDVGVLRVYKPPPLDRQNYDRRKAASSHLSLAIASHHLQTHLISQQVQLRHPQNHRQNPEKVSSPLKMQFVSKVVLAFALIGNAMIAVALPSPVAQVLPSTGNPSPDQDQLRGPYIQVVDVE